MAESKFLKYQDPSGDGLIDVCDEVIEVAPVICEDCKCLPNGASITPNWLNLPDEDAYLNEKNCLYQVVIITKYTTTLSSDSEDELEERYEEYADQAVEALLDAFDKDDGAAAQRSLKDVLEYTDYDLPARPKSRLKLLYSVPFDTLCALEGSDPEEDDDSDSEDAEIEVTYTISELKSKLIYVRKGLHLYGVYSKPWRFIENSNLFFQEGPFAGKVFNLTDYGDRGILGGSVMAKLLPQLDDFLNRKGLNIKGVGGFTGMFGDRVVKLTFTFTGEYELKKLLVYTEECGEKPIIFLKKLRFLLKQSSWKDSTAMGYLAQLTEMERDLMAREPIPWLEFVKKYTFPTIYSSVNQGYSNTDPEKSVGSCVAEALQNEAKQIGQDILDIDFSIGDALAYKIHTNLCGTPIEETQGQAAEIGYVYDPEKDITVNVVTMATEQAFQTIQQDDPVFANVCAGIAGNAASIDSLEAFWREGLDKLKLCGLNDVLMDAIQCVMGGVSLEEALSTIAESALRALSLENFGDLFVGLPADKQAELDALVKKKFENGEFFKDNSGLQQTSDQISGKLDYTKPWEDPEIVEANNETAVPGRDGEYPQTTAISDEAPSSSSRRTLVQQLDPGGEAKKQLSPNIVFEAYVLALIEVYSDGYFELLEELNKFPGAQLIAAMIATVDCPQPPLFDPNGLDFVKSAGRSPSCDGTFPITAPRFQNPAAWLPKRMDLTGAIFEALKDQIDEVIFKILVKLILKICELVGNASCKMLELHGDMAASLPATVAGQNNLVEVIKDSICGDEVDSEQIENTVVDMFATMGLGSAALADTEQVMNLTEDISASTTQLELSNAFLGNPSADFLKIVDSLIEYEYPDFRDALSSQDGIGSFFTNMGNLMPAPFKSELADFAENLPEGDLTPVNPSLCATPEQLENFCELRSQILEGRATPEQIEKLCDQPSDLGDLADVLQQGVSGYLANNMPPIFSDPGCDNGMLPYESEEASATATAALNGILEQLKVDFATDMLGNGPGEGRWGFINMVLSDTMGNPLTAHTRKADNKRDYVDFYTDTGILAANNDGWFDGDGAVILPKTARTAAQQGAFPYKIADWLEEYMQTKLTAEFASSNDIRDAGSWRESFENASIGTFRGGIDLLKLPDLGYNVEVRTDFQNEEIIYIDHARKLYPDMTLSFQDNCKGLWNEDNLSEMYSYGFDIEFYLSDIISGSVKWWDTPQQRDAKAPRNKPGDNVRIKINDKLNASAKIWTALAASIPELWKYTNPAKYKVALALLKPDNDEIVEIPERKFEFVASDNILDEVDLTPYPQFLNTFNSYQTFLPQVVLLDEMITNRLSSADLTKTTIKGAHDVIMSSLTQNFINMIGGNEEAFLYGAAYDNLSPDDVEYVIQDVIDGATNAETNGPAVAGTRYYDVRIPVAEDETAWKLIFGEARPIMNNDQILGISKMEFMSGSDANRVIYLDPNTFGGSYMNPPLYIKPVENKGWLGFLDVMYPEMSPCKPYTTDLIDFEDIQDKVNSSYPFIPEDERLKSDPDCIVEVPYARILDRSAVAGMESIITAAIRIYVSAYLIKSMATFTKFKPTFPGIFSSIYAAYIVEEMEASYKDAQKGFWEFFNPFKDTEFWYAFLEQSVQLYSRRVDSEEISDPPTSVVEALVRLNDMQEKYLYPYKEDRKDAREAEQIGNLEYLGKRGLKNYRQQKNLEAIQATEDDAKLILKELVMEQLNYTGEKFVENLKIIGMAPEVHDMGYYVLQSLSQGGEGLTLTEEIKEEYIDLPIEGEGYYTTGNEFAQEDGTEYVGYYHVELEGENPVYITGEEEGDAATGETLTPMAKKIIVPIGDISEYGAITVDTTSTTTPFVIEKYISINGTKYAPSTAVTTIKAATDPSQNISDVYPGNLSLVTDTNGQVVGIEGELGVRHGLRFSLVIDGTQIEVTTVEVDALDVALAQIDPLEGDSKLLLCLINLLKADEKFRLMTEYIFPLNKIVSTLAIYNGLAFMPSIGEKMVKDNQTVGKWYWGESADIWPEARSENTIYTKPGVALTFDGTTGNVAIYPPNVAGPDTATDDSTATIITEDESGTASVDLSRPEGGGWSSKLDRDPGLFGGLFVKEWDNWDQTLLRNSKSRIKKIFKSYYNSRDFEPGQTDDSDSPGTIITNEFKERFKTRPGQNLLPWWKRRMLRTNPFNADGEMCEKKD